MSMIRIAGETHIGQRRTDNQDTFICKTLWSAGDALIAVIDGVGGYAGGDRAAAIAKQSIEQYMSTPKGDTLTMLREAVNFANNQIVTEKLNDQRFSQMCCVITAAVADASAGRLFFAHVGDTRLYRFRNGLLEKLTRDHSLVGVREDAGELTEEEAMNHPRRNEILREAGSIMHRIDDPDFLDYDAVDFLPQDLLLICSDGLSDMLNRAQMASILGKEMPLQTQVNELIALANQQGGHDNITLVLARNESPVLSATGLPEAAKMRDKVQQLPEQYPEIQATPRRQTPFAISRNSFRWTLALLVIVLASLAAVTWYWWNQPETITRRQTTARQPSDKTGSAAVTPNLVTDSLLSLHAASPKGSWLELSTVTLGRDSLILYTTLVLKDSVVIGGAGDPLVITPADSTGRRTGLFIEKNSVVRLENVVFSGFDVAIGTAENVRLHLKKVYFNRVGIPVRAELRRDTCINEELNFTSGAKTDHNP